MEDVELIKLYVKEHSVSNFAISNGKLSCLVFEVKDQVLLHPICVAYFYYHLKVLGVRVFLDPEAVDRIHKKEKARRYHDLPNFFGGNPILSQVWDWGFVDFGDVLAFLSETKPPEL